MERKSEKEILRQQMILLAEESKNTYPASNELSQNSFAMVKISNELLKRKWFSAVLFIALCNFVLRVTKHSKQFFR